MVDKVNISPEITVVATVGALPSAASNSGVIQLVRNDNNVYRSDGASWTAVDTVDAFLNGTYASILTTVEEFSTPIVAGTGLSSTDSTINIVAADDTITVTADAIAVAGLNASQITAGTLAVSVGGTGSSSFSSGDMVYSDGSVLTTADQLNWNDANSRLSVGYGVAAGMLSAHSSDGTNALYVVNSGGGSAARFIAANGDKCASVSNVTATATANLDLGPKFQWEKGRDGAGWDVWANVAVRNTTTDNQSHSALDFYLRDSPGGGSDAHALTLTSEQYVGIAQTAPTYNLDVDGTMRSTGLASLDGGLTVPNNVSINAKESGGTARGIFYIDGSDDTYIGGTGGTLRHLRLSAGGALDALVIEQTTGDVGIGTAAPAEKLHIAESVNGDMVGLLIENSTAADAGTNETVQILAGFGGNNAVGMMEWGKESDYQSGANEDSYWAVSTDLNGSLGEAMRANSAGIVTVGSTTSDPSFLFRVVNNAGASAAFDRYHNTPAAQPSFQFRRARGTEGSEVNTEDDDALGAMLWVGHNGTNFNDAAAQIAVAVDGVSGGPGDLPGRMMFYTTPDASGTPVERIRIVNDGKVGIGTTTPSGILHVDGGLGTAIINSGLSVGTSATPTAGYAMTIAGAVLQNATIHASYTVTLQDDEVYSSIPANLTGFGFVQLGGEEYAQVSFTSAAVVTLVANSANVANTDSDGNLCIYDGGSQVLIRNRLGSAKTLIYNLHGAFV